MERKQTLPPGFEKVKADLEAKGRPWEWILKTVDAKSATAVYLPAGKPWYKSECPAYEGIWLDGGTGSVQCSAVSNLLPSLQHLLYCSENCKSCQHYPAATAEQSERK